MVERVPRIAVPGLTVRRRGESLETVRSSAVTFHLLSSLPNMELIQGTLAAGERLTVVPGEDFYKGLVEAWYILEGALRCDLAEGPFEIGPGDCITAQHLQAITIFSAKTSVRFLYVSTLPTFHELSDSIGELKQLAVEVEMKDGYTADHCSRLQRLSFATGRELNLPHYRLHLLDCGAYLHDVGKVRVPLEILNKPAKLTTEEFEVIKRHPTFGREMLDHTWMKPSGRIVEQHHERLDGSGYPYGIAGDEVLVESYIVAVTDTYDAMTTDRPYRKALFPEEAFAELQKYAGTHYPEEVVRAFFSAVKQVELVGS